MRPPKRITDPTFKYVDAAHTNIRRTFERFRREQKEAEANLPGNRQVVALRPLEKTRKA